MDRRKLTYYLLLNVFVSACVTLSVLYWYDRNYRAVALPQAPAPAQTSNSSPSAAAESISKGTIEIVSVIGAGNLQAEAVVIRYAGAGELDLTGWHLKDGDGQTFTFPPFQLFRDGAVQVHSGSGTNTAIDLYWGQRQAAWQSGSSVLLTTPEGDVQDSYPVP